MLTVFSRRKPGCNFSEYSVAFDGTNDYLEGNTSSHWPGFTSFNGGTNQCIVSLWVRVDALTSPNATMFIMTQTGAGLGQGNVNDDFFRLAYQPKTGTGVDRNRLYVSFRGDGTAHMLDSVYELHGSGNSTITGLTSVTDQWTANSTNIITNIEGFVHLCVVMDLPPTGIPFGSAGDIKTYWNGTLLPTKVTNTKAGVGQPQNSLTYGALGVNGPNLNGFHNGKVDEVLTTTDYYGQTTPFKSAFSLTTPQDIATFLWNNGCPKDVSHPNDYVWNYNNYRFENNYNSENVNLYPFTSYGGATFSTDHA